MSADAKAATQPLVAHLLELRNRLLKIVGFVLLIFLSLVYFSNEIYQFVAQPLQALLPDDSGMIATDVASPFLTPFKLTFFVALFASVPIILYQVWAFIAPGLYDNEKRIAFPLLASSVLLFYGGMAFAYFVVFPMIFGFFTAASPDGVTVMTDISSYLNFVLKLFFAFGVAFEIPVATVLLIWAGVIEADKLADKRPYVVIACFVIGMLLTPPDVISQSMLALPMWLLFEVGLLFGKLIAKKRAAAETESD